MSSLQDSNPNIFHRPEVVSLREDLALALRAAASHGLAEGVCNHFSVALPGDGGLFLLNPRGLMWSEVTADDIVVVDSQGQRVAEARFAAGLQMIRRGVEKESLRVDSFGNLAQTPHPRPVELH